MSPDTDCTKCGCNDSSQLPDATSWGKPVHKRECNHCGFTYKIPPHPLAGEVKLPTVHTQRTRCPTCQSAKVLVTNSRRRADRTQLRYYTCQGCRCRFRLVVE